MVCRGQQELFYKYRSRAKKKRLAWQLTLEEFCAIVSKKCAYCGKRPASRQVHAGGKQFTTLAVGVDRKNNKKGYVLSNCVPCCWACNNFKGSLTSAQFLKQVKRIYRFLEKNNG